jgi:hypothetical protein
MLAVTLLVASLHRPAEAFTAVAMGIHRHVGALAIDAIAPCKPAGSEELVDTMY